MNKYLVASADGKTLGEHDRWPVEAMRRGLTEWARLPAAQREPRPVSGVPRIKAFPAPPEPPPGGLILKAHIRALQRDEAGGLSWTGPMSVAEGAYNLPAEPQLDHVWLTRDEWNSMIPADPHPGDVAAVRPAIASRIAVFHLLDKGLGGDEFLWPKAHAEMQIKVVAVTTERLRMELNGMAHVGPRGADAVRLQGRLEVDRKKGEFIRFDLIALGRDDGDPRSPEQRMARNSYWYRVDPKHKVVMAVAFELVDGSRAIDRVPPYGIMFGSERVYNRPYLTK